MIITGDNIHLYRLMVLRKGLQLESMGMKVKRGVSCLKTLRSLGFTGTRKQIQAQLDDLHAQIHRTTDEA